MNYRQLKSEQKLSKNHSTHEVLAYFIDNKLSPNQREETLKHLIYCDDCSDIIAILIKYIKKKY